MTPKETIKKNKWAVSAFIFTALVVMSPFYASWPFYSTPTGGPSSSSSGLLYNIAPPVYTTNGALNISASWTSLHDAEKFIEYSTLHGSVNLTFLDIEYNFSANRITEIRYHFDAQDGQRGYGRLREGQQNLSVSEYEENIRSIKNTLDITDILPTIDNYTLIKYIEQTTELTNITYPISFTELTVSLSPITHTPYIHIRLYSITTHGDNQLTAISKGTWTATLHLNGTPIT